MSRRTIAVATGSRAEFGLLRPVMSAIDRHPRLDLQVLVTGCHLLPPETVGEVRDAFHVDAEIPMQRAGESGRWSEAEALGRGIEGFARCLRRQPVDALVVLGDRVEALAAATAAAIGGVRVAHLHGGDRAPGIVDEGVRHAITKLAHLHLAASEQSAQRLVAMGEDPDRVHVVGSPALDDLASFPALDDDAYEQLGRPDIVLLLHPAGATAEQEQKLAERVLAACRAEGRVLALHPNHDPGRHGILAAIEAAALPHVAHLPRARFVGLLRRTGAIVGNSSAALIECAALGVPAVNVGPRQDGRERADNVIDVPDVEEADVRHAVRAALARPQSPVRHPYGVASTNAADRGPRGAGGRTASVLASFDNDRYPLTKRNTY